MCILSRSAGRSQVTIYVNIVNSTLCRANNNASLAGFAKRSTAAISPPALWDIDVFADALQIVQPAWQCKAVCGQERVLHTPDLTLVLSFPVSTGENCHLDCLEPTQTTFWPKRFSHKRFETLLAVVSFTIVLFFSRKCLTESTLNITVAVITYMCLLLCMALFISGRLHILYQRAQLAYGVINTTVSTSLIGVITTSLFHRFSSLGLKSPIWLKMASCILSAFNVLEHGPFTTYTALLLITHIFDLDLQYLFSQCSAFSYT
ncbi:uncharacterized protein Bfra_010337 [Botrytis fragariae]|uniref:Uncharacterized protein n=1 Tax=Botrytis fragariae TaxID=1964551 RepID=A0A8H6AMH5_9HELO|nr:uncharacterized protein Bfra_010337 [Botrytis fragariae]KAF5870192.1 hypothetical protein Bfra_010337 [Botrytis fragariae]